MKTPFQQQPEDSSEGGNVPQKKQRRSGADNNPPFLPIDTDVDAVLMFVGLQHLSEPAREVFADTARAWLALPWQSQAALIKTLVPELTDCHVAVLLGLSLDELTNDSTYSTIKEKLGRARLHKPPQRRLKNAPYWTPQTPDVSLPSGVSIGRLVTGLLGVEERDFERFRQFWKCWRELLWPRKAMLAKFLLQDVTDQKIVLLLGIRRETLQRHCGYREFKLRNSPGRLTRGPQPPRQQRRNGDEQDEEDEDDLDRMNAR